jgi:hypothetical protein
MSWLFMYVGFAPQRETVVEPKLRYIVAECAIAE